MQITNNDIRRYLGLPEADRVIMINQVDSIDIQSNTLMFVNNPGVDLSELDHSVDSVFLVNESYSEYESIYNDFIRVDNPKYWFSKIVSAFNLVSRFQRRYPEQVIGKGCQFDPGTIIGGTDFSPVIGMTPDELIQFPQMGGVYIGNDVVVKYNSMIGKGTFDYTVIGSNTMIDYGCQIGHNCKIGPSCIIAAGTIIGGSTIIGSNTVIGIGAKIRNGITIGNNVSIGMGSVVIHDVPDNAVVVGNPAHIIDHKPIFDKGGLK